MSTQPSREHPESAANVAADRTTIDRVDRELLALIDERLRAAESIGANKRATHLDLHDPDRERALLDAWGEIAEARGLSRYFVGRILREILNYSRRRQERPRASATAPARAVTVGFQGASGAYSELALERLFALRDVAVAHRAGYPTFHELGAALANGAIDYAVLPVENSTSGSVDEASHLLASGAFRIVDEDYQDIDHCLVGLPGSTPSGILTVRSHPVALRQCRRALARLPHAHIEPWHDTAGAADSVVECGDPTLAAICSADAAAMRGLTVLRRGLADHARNQTRFVLLARNAEDSELSVPSKASLLLGVDHRCGALARCLSVFADRGINLTRLESRPQPGQPWEYLFLVDVEGHAEAPAVRDALDAVRAEVNSLRVLGSYPDRSLDGQSVSLAPRATASARDGDAAGPNDRDTPARATTPALAARTSTRTRTVVEVGRVRIGDEAFTLIAGPCAVESQAQIHAAAAMVKESGAVLLRGGAFKPRTSPYSFQGLGMPGVDLLVEAGRDHELPVVTEVLRVEDVEAVAARADMLQIGARNMQNFELLKAVGRVDRPVLLKRGLSATIQELLQAADTCLPPAINASCSASAASARSRRRHAARSTCPRSRSSGSARTSRCSSIRPTPLGAGSSSCHSRAPRSRPAPTA